MKEKTKNIKFEKGGIMIYSKEFKIFKSNVCKSWGIYLNKKWLLSKEEIIKIGLWESREVRQKKSSVKREWI